MATITVGLVTYNRAHLLGRAIEAVLNQTFQDFTLIISDDYSSDNTEEIVESYLKKDSRIFYIKRKRIGMTDNFVQTLRDASTPYFMWLCDDDYMSENFLARSYQFLNDNPSYIMACGATRFTIGGEVLNRTEFLHTEDDDPAKRVCAYYQNVNSNIILFGLMRRDEVKDLEYPDTFGADLLWSSQIVFGGKIKTLDDINFYYSLEGISQQTSNLKEYYKTTKKIKKNPYEILRACASELIFYGRGDFSSLSYFKRVVLAIKVWFILRERFCMSAYEAKIRSSLKLRTRLKALLK